jgi:hypothetical protein
MGMSFGREQPRLEAFMLPKGSRFYTAPRLINGVHRIMRIAAPLLAAALLGAPAVLHAQAQPAAPQSLSKTQYLANVQGEFGELDTNKDGTLTGAEIDAARAKALATAVDRRADEMMAELDSDKNGSLSRAELVRGLKPSREPGPAPVLAMDGNKDGKVTSAEFKSGMEARFARLDGNKDGVITQAELRTAAPSR